MSRSTITDNRKRGPGRPKVGASLIGVRVPPAELSILDKWIKDQAKPKPSRPEAIRQLVAAGLESKTLIDEIAAMLKRGDVDGCLKVMGFDPTDLKTKQSNGKKHANRKT